MRSTAENEFDYAAKAEKIDRELSPHYYIFHDARVAAGFKRLAHLPVSFNCNSAHMSLYDAVLHHTHDPVMARTVAELKTSQLIGTTQNISKKSLESITYFVQLKRDGIVTLWCTLWRFEPVEIRTEQKFRAQLPKTLRKLAKRRPHPVAR